MNIKRLETRKVENTLEREKERERLTIGVSISIEVSVQQFQSLRGERSSPLSFLVRFHPDEVRQLMQPALVPVTRKRTLFSHCPSRNTHLDELTNGFLAEESEIQNEYEGLLLS